MQKEEWIVDGLQFGNLEDAKKAQEEFDRVKLLKDKIDYNDLGTVRSIYDKAIENHVFVTPIGIQFLKELQLALLQHAKNQDLAMIPVPTICVTKDATQDHEEELSEEQLREASKLRVRVESLQGQLTEEKAKCKKTRRFFQTSKMLNIVLLILIGILFFITMTGENANALNYKRVLTDRYASWEEDLTQREQALKEAQQNNVNE